MTRTLIETPAAVRDRLQQRYSGRWQTYAAHIRSRATARLRSVSVALIGCGSLLIVLGVGLRNLRRRIEYV